MLTNSHSIQQKGILTLYAKHYVAAWFSLYLYGQTVYVANGISRYTNIYTNNAAYASSSVYASKEYNPAICLTTDYSYTHGYMHIAIATNITVMMMMMMSVHPSVYIIAIVFIHMTVYDITQPEHQLHH